MHKNKLLLTSYFILFAVGVLSLVYYDFIFVNKEERDSVKQVAYVLKLKNDVKFRSNKSLIWLPVNENEFFLNGDKVFTAEKSELFLETINKNQFSIKENTLIKVREGVVSLNKGSVTAFVSSKMSMFINGKKLDIIPNGKSIINLEKIDDVGDIISVSEGEVEVYFEGKKLTLLKGQQSKIDPRNILSRTGLKRITLITQLYDNYLYCGGSKLLLDWKSEVDADKYVLKFYRDSTLKNKFSEQIVNFSDYQYNSNQFIDKFYLQIIGYRNDKEVSLLDAAPITMISKRNIPNIRLPKNEYVKGSTITLNNSEKINQFLSKENFYLNLKHKKSQKVVQAINSSIDSSILDIGKQELSFCYQHLACENQIICSTTDFNLKRSQIPVLESPTYGEKIHILKDEEQLSFFWSLPKKDDYKDLELILKDETFNTNIPISLQNYKVGQNETLIKLIPGKYSWMIKGIDQSIPFETTSKDFSVKKVALPSKVRERFLEFGRKVMEYSFQWSKNDNPSENISLEYRILDKITRVKLSKENIKNKTISLKLPLASIYDWRLVGKDNRRILYKTPWKEVFAPSCRKQEQSKLDIITYKKNSKDRLIKIPSFKWPQVEGALKYKIKIFQYDEYKKKTSFEYTTYKTQFKWWKAIPKDLSWTVTPVDLAGKDCVTSELGKYKAE